jgi:PelA/Pel-15E family pectate lyase
MHRISLLLFIGLPVCLLQPASAQTPPASSSPAPVIKLELTTDFLALHLRGSAPEGTTAIQYRLAETGRIDKESTWIPAKPLSPPGTSFTVDIPLPASCWSELQVRALNGEQELAVKKTTPDQDEFKLLSSEHLSVLPPDQQKAWQDYLKKSKDRSNAEFDFLAAECRKLGSPNAKPAPDNSDTLELDSDTPEEWFAGAEANALADAVISYQTPSGGWSKSVDYKAGPRQPGGHWTSQKGDPWHYCGTFDNRTTTEQIKLLAGVFVTTKRADVKTALMKGLHYLFEAQYPNGGWPQNYPVESGYHEAITLNDDAMTHILEILQKLSEGNDCFSFADEALRQRARDAFDKGIKNLVAMQVRIDDKPTVWCAQHHPITLEPAQARAKEPPSLSGAESANLVKFLMRSGPTTPEVIAMIEAALMWFEANRLTGLRKTKNAKGKTDYVADPASTDVLWARFYDLKTSRPIFAGANDGIVYHSFQEMAAKNKVAYDFFSTRPGDLLTKELPRWKKRLSKEK